LGGGVQRKLALLSSNLLDFNDAPSFYFVSSGGFADFIARVCTAKISRYVDQLAGAGERTHASGRLSTMVWKQFAHQCRLFLP
ncbi:MAG: hypothetical protein ACRD4F_01255, partial [Candidatus Angelobacter sp.]